MNLLRAARVRLFEHNYYGGNFGDKKNADEYIADSLNRWNTAPPTRVRFCEHCGAEVPHLYDFEWQRAHAGVDELDPERSAELLVALSNRHYDSRQYRFREDARESFDGEALW